MKEMRTLGRIVLMGVALLVLLKYAMQTVAMIPFWLDRSETEAGIPLFISALLATGAAFAILYFCIVRSDILLDKLLRIDDETQQIRCPVTCAFRLVAVAAGLLCLFWTLPMLVNIIYDCIGSARGETGGRLQFFSGHRFLTWGYLGGTVLRLALGIYLVCGAPHFTRWHVKKIVGQVDGAAASSR